MTTLRKHYITRLKTQRSHLGKLIELGSMEEVNILDGAFEKRIRYVAKRLTNLADDVHKKVSDMRELEK